MKEGLLCYWGDDRVHHDGKRPRGCLVLHKASVSERESARGVFEFAIRTGGTTEERGRGSRELVVRAASLVEAQEWMTVIRKVSRQARPAGSFSPPPSSLVLSLVLFAAGKGRRMQRSH